MGQALAGSLPSSLQNEADYANMLCSAKDVEFDLNPNKVEGGTTYLIFRLPSLFRHLDEVCSTQGWSLTIEPSGVNLYRLKEIMGHADMKTTMKYAHLRPDALREEMRKCFR